MTYRLYEPGQRLFKPDGTLLTNGSIKFLEPGSSSTLRPTYSDPDLGTANANPLNVGSDGIPVSPIWMNGAYRVMIYSGAGGTGTVLADEQPVIRANQSGTPSVFSSSLTSFVGYEKGALLAKADGTGYWQNTAANNLTNPDEDGAGWIDSLQWVLPETLGAKGDGIADDRPAIIAAVATGRQVRFTKGRTYKVSSAISASTGVAAYFEEGSSVVGTNNVLFNGVFSGEVRIEGRGTFSGLTKLVDFASGAQLSRLKIHGAQFAGGTNPSAATVGALISYFGNDVAIDTIDIADCRVTNGREGFLFRGTWNTARIYRNKLSGVQHYSIRLGQDRETGDQWALQGDAKIFGNDIRDMYNPVTGSGSNECDAIAVFSQSADIHDNFISNIDSAGVDDCEGIYTKIQHGTIHDNILVDAGRREGSIVVKGVVPKETANYVQTNTVVIHSNVIWFEKSRSHECSISIQASHVDVFGNTVQAGAGVNNESAGIVIKYRSPYTNIDIHDNKVYCPLGQYGILLWAYGKNISVKNNEIFGAATRGIQIETRTNADVRYPSTAPIGENYVIEGNILRSTQVDALAGMTRGINFTLATATPLTNVVVKNNKCYGAYSEYSFAYAGSSSNFVEVTDNEFWAGPITFFSAPTRLRYKNRRRGSTSTSSYATVMELPMAANSVVYTTFKAMGIQSDNSNRAVYDRAAVYYRNGGAVTLQGIVVTAMENETDVSWDARFLAGADSLQHQFRGLNGSSVTWDNEVDLTYTSITG